MFTKIKSFILCVALSLVGLVAIPQQSNATIIGELAQAAQDAALLAQQQAQFWQDWMMHSENRQEQVKRLQKFIDGVEAANDKIFKARQALTAVDSFAESNKRIASLLIFLNRSYVEICRDGDADCIEKARRIISQASIDTSNLYSSMYSSFTDLKNFKDATGLQMLESAEKICKTMSTEVSTTTKKAVTAMCSVSNESDVDKMGKKAEHDIYTVMI